MNTPNTPTRRALEAGAHWLLHAGAMVLGTLLILLAVTFGVPIVTLPVAVVVAAVGLLIFLWGVTPGYRAWRSQREE
jgi:nitrogen fixation-related uncharacterized protein